MNDDRSVRCYALLAEHLSSGVDNTAQVKELWLGQKEADEGCAAAAEQLRKDHTTSTAMVWQRARLGMENDRLRVATQAVGIVSPRSESTVNAIYLNPKQIPQRQAHRLSAQDARTGVLGADPPGLSGTGRGSGGN
jgi:soluble lytic murein transglycosylase